MMRSSRHFFPLAISFVILLFLLVTALLAMIEIGITQYAYEKIGINKRSVFGLLLLSLLGSWVHIPVAELPAGRRGLREENQIHQKMVYRRVG